MEYVCGMVVCVNPGGVGWCKVYPDRGSGMCVLSVHVSGTSIAYEGLEPIDTLFIVVGDVVSYGIVWFSGMVGGFRRN